MKKLITQFVLLFTVILLTVSANINAQDLEIIDGYEQICHTFDADDEYDADYEMLVDVKNISDRTISFNIKLYLKEVNFMHVMSLCIEFCYTAEPNDDGVFVVPDIITLAPGQTLSDVSGIKIQLHLIAEKFPSPRTSGLGSFALEFVEVGTDNSITLSTDYDLKIGAINEEAAIKTCDETIDLISTPGKALIKIIPFANTGNEDLIITELFLTGADKDAFTIINPVSLLSPLTVDRKHSKTIKIEFNGETAGDYDAVLNFKSNSKSETKIILKGKVVETSINEEFISGIKAFPQPAVNVLNITNDKVLPNSTLQIFNTEGVLMIEEMMQSNMIINLSKLPSASYMYRVKQGDKISSARTFVIAK